MAGGRLRFGYVPFPSTTATDNSASHNTTVVERTFRSITVLQSAEILFAFAMVMMMEYLTNVWDLSTAHAAGIINVSDGIKMVMYIVFAFFVDAFMGAFYMLVLSSIAFTIGLGLLFLSMATFFGQCSEYKEECVGHTQKVMFFTALSFLAVGLAGHEVSWGPFELLEKAEAEAQTQALTIAEAPTPAEDEVEVEAQSQAPVSAEAPLLAQVHAEAEAQAQTQAPTLDEAYFLPQIQAEAEVQTQAPDITILDIIKAFILEIILPILVLILYLLVIAGGVALAYIKPWSILFGIPAVYNLIVTVWFLVRSQRYKDIKAKGSPLTFALRVFVAAATKDFYHEPSFTQIYKDDDTQETKTLRWLDKAAIKFPDQAMSKSWTLCTVGEVEHTKTLIRMVPMLLTFIGTGVIDSIGNTYFLEQANHMDHKLGSINIPITIFLLFYLIAYATSELIFWDLLKKFIAIPERYYAPAKIVVGMVLSVLCCITAAIVETQRLHVIRNQGLRDKSTSMSVFYLLPQFLFLGAIEGITESAILEFLNDKAPKWMHRYLIFFHKLVMGLGHLTNVLLVYVVGKVSEINNNPNWFQHTSNKSRLDLYYWTLAGVLVVNLVIFARVAFFYYRESPSVAVESESLIMHVD